jgi:hypothetical protein
LGVGLSKIERARLPRCETQIGALEELRTQPQLLHWLVVEAIGEAVNDAARIPTNHPNPKRLYPGQRVPLVRYPDLCVPACLAPDGRTVLYRPCRERRDQGWELAHELSEAVLRKSRWDHTHADVQRGALAILLPRSIVAPLVRRLGARAATSELIRRHRHCPAWAVVYRVAWVAAALVGRVAA